MHFQNKPVNENVHVAMKKNTTYLSIIIKTQLIYSFIIQP